MTESIVITPVREVSTQVQPNRQSAISVSGLFKKFGAHQVLGGVSFEIADNEMLVVLGPSGSGKTTLLRLIAGLEQPDAGDMFLQGVRTNDIPPQARGIGVVFQEQALFQRMSVEQNIAFGMKLRGTPTAQLKKRVDELLELTRLEAHRRKIPARLSGGQRQRVAVARALAFNPAALLFDEPFSALDAVTRTELRREVRAILHEMQVPALFISMIRKE